MSATELAMESLLGRLESVIVPPDRELTLVQQAGITGISAANLIRRWQFDSDWFDAIYAVGETHTDYRTTLARIITCQDRAANRTRAEYEARKQVANRHKSVAPKRAARTTNNALSG